jgi:MFS family permease
MLAILFGLYVMSLVDRYVIIMLVPSIKHSLSISDSEMGMVLGPAFSIIYALFGIPLGWAADRLPRRWVIFMGTILFACATVASAKAGSFVGLFIARACVAIGEASLSPAAYSLMADRFPRTLLTTAGAIFNAASYVGKAAAYTIGGVALGLLGGKHLILPLLGAFQSWQFVFLMTGVPSILIALLVFTFRDPPRLIFGGSDSKTDDSAVSYLLVNWRVMFPMLAGLAFAGICSSALSAWVPTYLTRHYGMSPAHFGPILGVINVVTASTLVIKGGIVDWLYARGVKDIHIRFYTWILAASLPVAFGMFFVKSAMTFIIMYGAVDVIALTLIVYLAATIQLIVPARLKGRIISVFYLILSLLGIGVGPLIVGLLTDHVFRDELKVGWSLAAVVFTMLPLALVSFRWSLKPIREAMALVEEAPAAVPVGRVDGAIRMAPR